ncbi:MAG TPA: 4-(cytidine 5'-diphospho)-2-C-methyl-D-erythritol kinase [Victivallales bacterium]|nr:4-(cytidine 5'-diphospho)-2-C-methyl-D-erythritol kinase [Victivallales bacterium]HRR06549.1 4-(cytidine 5'-diphospho)-2-C-methyl-D-erythritol kinase [Victivallales bacterium]HRU00760.1 4-(cytidine 5'-diphospho)-2-C-methyl-D-erythritol kinase [Victivallales bacterium]
MRAIAKINLFLEIKNKRNDGYHEIKTVFYPLFDLYDDIEIESYDFLTIETDHSDLPINQNNICWKAAQYFASEAAIEPRWKIKIKKRIPISAGLGGGSSDAAIVLKILDNLYPGRCEIRKIAKSLGADVNYFLNPVISLGEGIGENLSNLNINLKIPLLIVNPLFPVSSAWAYKNYFSNSSVSLDSFLNTLKSGDIANIAKNIRNDLAPALYKKFPFLEMIKESLFQTSALGVEISGSGSSLFAIYKSRDDLIRAKQKIESLYENSVLCFISC